MKYVLLFLILFFIPVIGAYAEESEECVFTSYIEKTWVNFGERPWVTGFVYNCDSEYFEYYTSNEGQYHKKDMVYVRILDVDGNLVEDDFNKNTRNTAKTEKIHTKYIFNDSVYRGGGLGGNADTSQAQTIYIRENQFFFYMPQIHSIDFEHRGFYQVELTYDDHVNTVWFAVLNPDIHYNEIEKEDEEESKSNNQNHDITESDVTRESEVRKNKDKSMIKQHTDAEKKRQDILDKYNKAKTEQTKSRGADSISEFDLALTVDALTSMHLKDKFEMIAKVWNIREGSRGILDDAKVSVEISRDDYVLKKSTFESNVGGLVEIEIDDMIYPMFYPKLCYDVKITTTYQNYTYTYTDDFVMKYPRNLKQGWEADMNWITEERYKYLPQEFRDEPRPTIREDKHCN